MKSAALLGFLCLLIPSQFALSATPSCSSLGWSIEVQWNSPLGIKTAPLPKRWNKNDTSYLNLIARPQKNSAPLTRGSTHFTADKSKKTALTSSITSLGDLPEGYVVLSDFLKSLGTKKNWPGTLRVSLGNSKSPEACAEEARIYVAD